jgi:hypothetical protein
VARVAPQSEELGAGSGENPERKRVLQRHLPDHGKEFRTERRIKAGAYGFYLRCTEAD